MPFLRRRFASDPVVVTGLAALAAALRLPGLATPARPVFDEIYYAVNGCLRLLEPQRCGVDEFASRAHPPGGELIIGAGQWLLGPNALGWRLPSALAGVLLVVLTYFIARRLLSELPAPRLLATGAALLVATDPMAIALSRVAMLDGLLATVAAAAVLTALRIRLRPGRLLTDPALLATAALLGVAFGIKWSGALLAPLLLAVVVINAPRGQRVAQAWRAALVASAVAGVVYIAVFATGLTGDPLSWPLEFVQRHARMLAFHRGLDGHHPYESGPIGWILLQRPVVLHYASDGSVVHYLLAAGNPLAWWAGLIGSITAFGLALTRRAPVLALIGAGLACWWTPWLIIGAGRSQLFIYYLAPAIPFLAIAAVFALAVCARRFGRRGGMVLSGALAALIMVAAIRLLPLATGAALSPGDVQQRLLFDDGCPPQATAPYLPADDEVQSGKPPSGWCWG